MSDKLMITYIDTCPMEFLTDHCNGDNETLIGVRVDNTTTIDQLSGLLEIECILQSQIPEHIPDGPIMHAIAKAIYALPATDDTELAAPFLPDIGVDGFDGATMWFRAAW